MKAAFKEDFGIPVDSHVFGVARADQWVNDGDTKSEHVMETLKSWLPRNYWYKANMEIAGLGQILDRGGNDAERLVQELLNSVTTRQFIVRVCSSPLYVDRAFGYIQKQVNRSQKLKKYVLCVPLKRSPGDDDEDEDKEGKHIEENTED
jgi:hypothetical protein